MKKIYLVFSLIISISLFSQIREKGNIEFTPFIGYSQANYLSNQYLGAPIEGIHLGLTVDYFINNRWSLRSGLMHQKMGSKGTFFGEYEERLNYITVPINANWHFGSTRKWYLNFGPSISFLSSAKAKTSNISYDPLENGFIMGENIKDYVKPMQVSFNFGIGYKIEITQKFSIMIDHTESIGLMKVNKYENNNDIINVFGSFNLGAVFKL